GWPILAKLVAAPAWLGAFRARVVLGTLVAPALLGTVVRTAIGTFGSAEIRPALAGLAGVVVALAHAGFSHAASGMAFCWGCCGRRRGSPHRCGLTPGLALRINAAGEILARTGISPLISDRFGGVSRAAKGADCKSAGYAFVGSSPTSPTSLRALTAIRLSGPPSLDRT